MSQSSTISRRDFLSTAGKAAIAIPSATALATAATSPRVTPSERVTLGIIGCGLRGLQLAAQLPPTATCAAVCDCNLPKAEALRGKIGDKVHAYQDYRKLLDHNDIDAVLITACDHHHVLMGIQACMAGKDIYVEKPASIYVREGRALVDAVRNYDRVAQTGTHQRSMEVNEFACELVRDGGIGTLKRVECVNFAGGIPYPSQGLPEEPIPPGLHWDLWQGQAPTRPYNRLLTAHWSEKLELWWGSWRDYSMLRLLGLGAHAFDMVQYALGTDRTGPVEFWPVKPGPNAQVNFRYANGVEVHLKFEDQRPYRGPRNGAVFVGSAAKIEINRNRFTTNPPDLVKNPPNPAPSVKTEAMPHISNWIECIKSRQRPNADIEIGHRVATICHLIDITRQLGRPLRWDPERELFPDDQAANDRLDRSRRRGWELPSIG